MLCKDGGAPKKEGKELHVSDGHSIRNSITVAERQQPEAVTPAVSHFQMYAHTNTVTSLDRFKTLTSTSH